MLGTTDFFILGQTVSQTRTFQWHKRAKIIASDGGVTDYNLVQSIDPQLGKVPLADQATALAALFAALRDQLGDVIISETTIDVIKTACDPLLHCQTGGTTAAPKRIARTCESWIKSFSINQQRFGNAAQIYATLGTLGHSLTLYAACEAIHNGATYLPVHGQNDPLGALNAHKVTVLYATPTQMRILALRAKGNHLAHLFHIMIGGGKLDETTRALITTLAPNAQIWQFYGAAETSFISISDATSPPLSVGKPFSGVEIQLHDVIPETGVGEIWVRSPYLFQGYSLGASTDTKWNQGWLTVGERGYFDEKGHLFISGRASRMFTVSDKNVFPEDIETWCLTHNDVHACAVLPTLDPLRGARVTVCIASENPELQAVLRAQAKQDLPPYLRPSRYIIFTPNEWPILGSGKPDLKRLADVI